MILKNYELNKINFEMNNFFLFYGENQGLKEECIEKIFIKKKITKTTYYERDILDNINLFYESIITKSFFEKKKIIIIKKATDKIKPIIDELIEKKIEDIIIIFGSDELIKKSKLRTFFEKNKNLVCVPFYADNYQSLSFIVQEFFKKQKISISREIINLIIERATGNRKHLKIELEKIKNYSINKKEIDYTAIQKLTNLGNDYNISELVDNCLAKNRIKLIKIMNENNFSNDETIIIMRTFLAKAKRLYTLRIEIDKNQNIEGTLSNYKPPIFWKDKDLVKQQIKLWSKKNIQNLLIEINKTELLIKKNFNTSLNILLDFIHTQSKIFNN